MKIVLTERIEKLGDRGDIREVKDGYGRNFLLPEGKAVFFGTEAAKNILREVQAKRIAAKQKITGTKIKPKLKKSEKRQLVRQEKAAKLKKLSK